MKVAFLSPFTSYELHKYFPDIDSKIPNGMGGSAVFELVHGLIESGIDLHLITLDTTANETIEFHSCNIHYYILPRRKGKALRDLYKIERKNIVNILKNINPNVVHANWTYEYALAALDYDVNKTIVTAHDIPIRVLRYSSFYHFPLFLISYYVYYKSKVLVFVSNSVKKYAEPFINRNKLIEIIPNIVDLDDINLSQIRVDGLPEKYFVSVGLWNKLKNFKYSLKAFNIFVKNNPEYYYILIGPGLDNNGDAYNYIRNNNLYNNVILLGKLSRNETLKIISKAKALIHPSFTEAWGMVIGEAMKLGVPVIVGKNSDGATELINYGEFGFMVDLNDKDDLVKQLQNIVNNFSENIGIINNAKNYIENNYSKNKIISSYIELYNYIIIN